MEVLYESFPDIDKDIDNRPYAYPNGEALCGAEDPFARGKEFQVHDFFCQTNLPVSQGNHIDDARQAAALMVAEQN